MIENPEVQQLEVLCRQLYESQDPLVRTEAEKALVLFQNSPDTLSKCQLLLEHSDSSYAQLLACTTLTKLVSRSSQVLPLQQRVDIRNYVLRYLATRPKLPNFVLDALASLFARISKLGWFEGEKDEFVFRNVVIDVTHFLQGSVEHCIIGVQLLSHLTVEMNQVFEPEANRSLTKHRKVASSFRDTQLLQVFRIACSLLTRAKENCEKFNFQDATQHDLVTQCLKLALNCLTFDFIGTTTDESSDDLCTVQIPTNWRPFFLEPTTLKLYFDLYHSLPSTLSHLALSCLVQLASVRRSLFSNAERSKFLTNLVNGVKHILQNPQGLRDPNNYHEFCRLLARLKSNYQLGELVMIESYPETIQLITKFTVESLQVWQFAPNSVHYLLSLWQRMVASVPYVKASEPHLLDTYTPQVTNAYLSARLEAVPTIIRESLDDPLDDMGVVLQQLEQVSVISRCDYATTCTTLVQVFDQTASLYQELVNSSNSNTIDIQIQEIRLTWLVYIIGAAVGGRVSFNTTEEHDSMDGEIVVRTLQLMNLTDNQLQQGGGCEKLELAFLNFFEQFRKIYIGEQVPKTSKVYRRLHEVLGIGEEHLVLSVFMRKIITNLKYWGSSEIIISKTLTLLNDLSVGYTSVRKLVKLEEVIFMLTNHTSEHFPFLSNNAQFSEMRLRSIFYTSLGRLLMVDLGEDEDRFEDFMVPVTGSLEAIRAVLMSSNSSSASLEEMKKPLIGLARDLRGIAFAFNSRAAFMLLFDILYPVYMPLFVRAVELWATEPAVTTPCLKLFTELVQNRSQRLLFDVTCPHGILLFREASKIICAYAKEILAVEPTKDELYARKLKGISICFSMLKSALCGNYVNFGIFALYGDDTLDNVLSTFVKLLLTVPRNGLLDYPKLSQTYYLLLECLALDHMPFLCSLEPPVFLYILSTISQGLTSIDTTISSSCCNILDHMATYLFKQLKIKEKNERKGITNLNVQDLRILELHGHVYQQMLSTMLNMIISDDCRSQWPLSRALLGLILINEQFFNQLRENLVRSQPPEKQASMAQWFENLMEGIERNLLSRNRDRFTQNLSAFKKEVSEKSVLNNSNSLNEMITS